MRILLSLILALPRPPPRPRSIAGSTPRARCTTRTRSRRRGANAKVLNIDAKAGPASPDTLDCYTVRCQGERLEQRLARREELLAQDVALRTAATPKPWNGLEFRKYISIQRGMTEGEMLGYRRPARSCGARRMVASAPTPTCPPWPTRSRPPSRSSTAASPGWSATASSRCRRRSTCCAAIPRAGRGARSGRSR